MSSVYTNIARKRSEQSQEASQIPSKSAVTKQVDTPPSNTRQSSKVEYLPNEKRKTTNPQTRLSTIQSPTHDGAEKVEKYTTHLEPGLIKKVKHYAVEKEIKDYEVVKNALLLYFEQNK